MKRLLNSLDFFILLLILIGLLFIYRQVVFDGRILFPSNFLAQFYSPWRTEDFAGWETGIPHKPIGDDQIRLFYPERTFANEMLRKGIIPLWNPHIFSGTPFLADFQSAIFYPANILYFFLPQVYAWEILLFIQPLMAIYFMYLFLNLFNLKKYAVWLGAISFGFSGFMLVWSQEHVAAGQAGLWLPLAIFGIEGYLTRKRLWYYFITIIALTCSILGGFIQITFYVLIFSFLYSLFRIKTLKLPFFNYTFKIICIYIFSLCLSAAQLLPSIEAFLESPRSTSSAWYLFEGYLLPITHLLNALIPDIFGNPGAYNFFGRGFYRETIFYAGLVPLVFAVYASFKLKINPVIRFFTFSVFISFFLTLDSPFTRWFFQLPVPLLPTFLPSRILFLTTFSISVLSAFGLSILINNIQRYRRLLFVIFSFLFMAFLLAAAYGLMLLNYSHLEFFKKLNDYIIRHGSSPTKSDVIVLLKNLVLPFLTLSFLFILLQTKKLSNFLLSGIILITLIGQFYFLNKYIVIGDPQFLYPKNPVITYLQSRNSLDRFLTFRQPMEENISTYSHIYSVEGANPVFPRRYGELLYAVKNNGKLVKDIPRIEARLSEVGEKENLFEDNRRLRLMSLLGIKHVLFFDDHNQEDNEVNKFPEKLFRPVWQSGNWYGLEYAGSLPRVFLANNIYIKDKPQEILDIIFDPEINLMSTIIVEEKPEEIKSSGNFINLPKSSANSFATIVSYEPQKIVINANTNTPQMLFLSDNYYPGWKAYVDGKETKIYRADYAFRSIYLPKGDHSVKFKYQPASFKVGFMISLSSVVIILLIIFFKLNKIRKFKTHRH
ncbi:MAG: YfhO family protein [Candidatus Levybacteria bacterium]|nr:YfhO family protein [Candidatus Levybacteria bacterium]